MAKVAFVLADDFEDSEFQVPHDKVVEAGHEAVVIGMQSKGTELRGKKGQVTQLVEAEADEVPPSEIDALVVPGGYSPDKLRTDPRIVSLVREVAHQDKPVAFICHAGSLLIEAGLVAGKRLTSWPSIRTDLTNAGAEWVDQEVVEDGNLISSRKPDDLAAFTHALLARLG